ncbi:MAG: hypothetical protein ACJZ83_03565 [Pseudohongiellaceae bacterium]|jgi:hypothetical protein|tara:strand:+ start:461 stop:625 length:165 start_codon:yes stop_codon:yes gene_type:complete
MTDKVVDFESRKQVHAEKRKEARIDALRRAFRQARGETEVAAPGKRKKRSRKKK